jgi:hypothetical protein
MSGWPGIPMQARSSQVPMLPSQCRFDTLLICTKHDFACNPVLADLSLRSFFICLHPHCQCNTSWPHHDARKGKHHWIVLVAPMWASSMAHWSRKRLVGKSCFFACQTHRYSWSFPPNASCHLPRESQPYTVYTGHDSGKTKSHFHLVEPSFPKSHAVMMFPVVRSNPA